MDAITKLFQNLDPLNPLSADENQLYVDWQKELMGREDLKPRLVREISRSGRTPIARLLTGHRGTGKTTELLRVKRILNQDRGIFVSFLEGEKWLDLEDVQAQDVVLQMIRQLLVDLQQQGVTFRLEKARAIFGELGDTLDATVDLEEVELDTGLLKFGMAIKDKPTVRKELRRVLEDRLPKLYDLVNQRILQPAREQLAGRGFNDILIVVDQLDRIPQEPAGDDNRTNHEDLFLGSSHWLRALDCDVIYTIPIELAYSHCQGRLKDAYGGEILTVPMISPDERGVSLLREIVARRAGASGAELPGLFEDPADLDRVCRLSGGHFRSLFMLLRGALNRSDALPIPREAVALAVRREAADFGKNLNPDLWKALDQVHSTHGRDTNESRWIMFLRERYVYAYYDPQTDGLWYDWNPLLGEVKR